MRFFPRYSFLRFLSPVAVFLFSAVVGVSFAAWLDAPNAPPNYGIVGCTPPCSQDDFKPMNLGTTPQTKLSSITADSFIDRNDPNYYLNPGTTSGISGLFKKGVGIEQLSPNASLVVNNPSASGETGSAGDAIYAYANSANAAVSAKQANAAGYAIYASGGLNYFGGKVGIGTEAGLAKLSINGGLHVGGDSDPGDNNALIDGIVTANGFYDSEAPAYYLDPGTTSGISGLFKEQVGIRQLEPNASLVVNNPSTSGKIGTVGDAIYAYANSTKAAISAEQGNSAGYAIYASGGLNFFGGDVRVGTAASPKSLCLNDDCKSVWPTVSGGTANYLAKWTGATALGTSAIYDNGNVGIGTTNPLSKLSVGGDGSSVAGIFGSAPSSLGFSYGVYGLASGGNGNNYGVYGVGSGGVGVYGYGYLGVKGVSNDVNGYSGSFTGGKGVDITGNLNVTGTITVTDQLKMYYQLVSYGIGQSCDGSYCSPMGDTADYLCSTGGTGTYSASSPRSARQTSGTVLSPIVTTAKYWENNSWKTDPLFLTDPGRISTVYCY